MAGTGWPSGPILYEIPVWPWLHELGQRHGRPVDLGTVPPAVWDDLGALGLDAVWLMGVWERSPESRRIGLSERGVVAGCRQALPDLAPDDVVGSPYSVRRYVVDAHLGGPEGLAAARAELARRGLRLLLDFVPNHTALDHPWTITHPEYFIHGTDDDLARSPASFVRIGSHVLANGRDPHFPAWTDVVQLDVFAPGARRAAAEALGGVAEQCDGVRCDMAMLPVTRVFARTWNSRAGAPPAREYWTGLIEAVRARHPGFLFVAEAYWDMEWELQRQGFDLCYDKRLYDRLVHDGADAVRRHLTADLDFQTRLVRFIENHDEPRAASVFDDARARAAAAVALTLPGARLLHDGQLEGRRVRLPVTLGRRPAESPDAELRRFYERLLGLATAPALRLGQWQLCASTGWADNASHVNLVAWGWRAGADRCLIVVNLSAAPAQGRIRLPWSDLANRTWRLTDPLRGEAFDRAGAEMIDPGLFVHLAPWGFHALRF